MKCMIPEISWHNREPVLCLDIQPIESEYYKLATGGSDCHLLIWQANIQSNGAVAVDMISDLTRHQRAINAVRWSPNGQYLASADDDANIIIWNVKTDNIPPLEGETNDKETWIITKILRGHKEDIYDLCWSPNSMKLLSGSIDNTAIIWDFSKGKIETILSDHKSFVQGVAWDPKGQFIATLGSDRICRVFDSNTKQIKARISKGTLPVHKTHALYNKEVKYFHDDTFKSYFRRLQFSPDGNLIITPCGSIETDDCKRALNATFLFTLDSLTQPAAILPLTKQYSTVVRCCPVLFELRTDGPDPIINLPYRMIIAVATESDIILYDTQQLTPFAHFQKIHYTRLTDLTWSVDGILLMASSTDGFCTFITFEANELGTEYVKEESEHDENVLNISGCEELGKEDTDKREFALEDKPGKSNFLMKWANQTQGHDGLVKKRLKMTEAKKLSPNSGSKKENVVNKSKHKHIDLLANCPHKKSKTENVNVIEIKDDDEVKINRITPKRITPIKAPERHNSNLSNKTATPIAIRKQPQNNDSNHKASPLLNFLKTGRTSERKTKFKSTCTADDDNAPVITILDESEARDAWKCEDNKQTSDKVAHLNTENESMTGTIPSDFKLQLEESTTDEIPPVESNLEIVPDTDEKKIDKNNDLNVNRTIAEKNDKLSETLREFKNNEAVKCISSKTGKKIPLITLSNSVPSGHKLQLKENPKASYDNKIIIESDGDKRQKVNSAENDLHQSPKNEEETNRNASEIKEKQNSDLNETIIESKSDGTVKCVSMKTGRRIPLITLSSPKTKRQRQDA